MSEEEACGGSDKPECHCLSCRMARTARRAGEDWADLNQLRAERDALVEAVEAEIREARIVVLTGCAIGDHAYAKVGIGILHAVARIRRAGRKARSAAR